MDEFSRNRRLLAAILPLRAAIERIADGSVDDAGLGDQVRSASTILLAACDIDVPAGINPEPNEYELSTPMLAQKTLRYMAAAEHYLMLQRPLNDAEFKQRLRTCVYSIDLVMIRQHRRRWRTERRAAGMARRAWRGWPGTRMSRLKAALFGGPSRMRRAAPHGACAARPGTIADVIVGLGRTLGDGQSSVIMMLEREYARMTSAVVRRPGLSDDAERIEKHLRVLVDSMNAAVEATGPLAGMDMADALGAIAAIGRSMDVLSGIAEREAIDGLRTHVRFTLDAHGDGNPLRTG